MGLFLVTSCDNNTDDNNSNINNDNNQTEEEEIVVDKYGLTYELCEDGTYAVVHPEEDIIAKEVHIPEEVNNKKVTKIGKYAFSDNKNIVKVYLNKNIKEIADYAFYGCDNLENVLDGDGLEKIAENNFNNEKFNFVNHNNVLYLEAAGNKYQFAIKPTDTSITEIVLNDNTVYLADGAFRDCKYATTISLGNSLKTISDYAFYGCEKVAHLNFPTTLKAIGFDSLYNCKALEEIYLPDGFLTFNDRLFGHQSLKEIRVPDSLIYFQEITTLLLDKVEFTEYDGNYYLGNEENPYVMLVYSRRSREYSDVMTIPEGCKIIADNGMSKIGYTYANTTILPTTLKSIGDSAFCSTTVSHLIINSHLDYIGAGAFSYSIINTVTFNENSSVKTVKDYAFNGCRYLEQFDFSKVVTSIGDSAFYGCERITQFISSDTLEYIGSNCLVSDGDVLTYLEFNSDQLFVGELAFGNTCDTATEIYVNKLFTAAEGKVIFKIDEITLYFTGDIYDWIDFKFSFMIEDGFRADIYFKEEENYYKPTSIYIDKEVELHDKCFYFLSEVKEVYISNKVTSIGKYILEGCKKVENVTVPDLEFALYDWYCPSTGTFKLTLTETVKVKDAIFEHHNYITEVVLSDKCVEIGERAFYYCTNLVKVTLGNNVEKIGFQAFKGCFNLANISFGDKLTLIGGRAFGSCSSLGEIYIPNNVITIDENAFMYCGDLMIYCEAESKPETWSNNWTDNPNNVIWNSKK